MKPRPIRVAHLLVAVVAAAALIEGLGVGPRWRHYYRRARQEDRQAAEYFAAARRFRSEAEVLLRASRVPGRRPLPELLRRLADAEYQADGFRQLGVWSEAIGGNYREALLRPWAPAAADPPFRRRSPVPGSMSATTARPR